MSAALLSHGVRAAIRHNATAYAYSVAITGSMAITQSTQGSPAAGDVFAFVLAAALAFVAVEAAASRGFRDRMRPERSDVVVLGSAISPVSIAASVGLAHLGGRWLDGWLAWAAAGFVATAIYLLLAGGEMALARKRQERRDDGSDEDDDEEERESEEDRGP